LPVEGKKAKTRKEHSKSPGGRRRKGGIGAVHHFTCISGTENKKGSAARMGDTKSHGYLKMTIPQRIKRRGKGELVGPILGMRGGKNNSKKTSKKGVMGQ